MSNTAIYLLLGSNLGDTKSNLALAQELIEKKIGKIINCSSLYQTAAWGITDQPDFLNQVLQIQTTQRPTTLLKNILSIEKQMGRIRDQKWGARLIDIDILYYQNKVIHTENLIIPHPFIQERLFTLLPLAEIAPNFQHPVLNKINQALMQDCTDTSAVKRL